MSLAARYATLVIFYLFLTSDKLQAQISSFTDLGTPPGKSFSCAQSINSSGQVAGYAFDSSALTAMFRPVNGPMIDIGTLGGRNSFAQQVNDAGQVVGTSDTKSGEFHAFTWDAGRGMTDLGTFPGDVRSHANRINAHGQIIGDSSGASVHAVLWQQDQTGAFQVINIGSLGGSFVQARAINKSGQVIGTSTTSSGLFRAFLWQDGMRMADLGNLPEGNGNTSAEDINDAGQVVGQSSVNGGFAHAFLWQSGKGMIDLGTLRGGRISEPIRINARGQIIGISDVGIIGQNHLVLWEQDETGIYQPMDLGTDMGFPSAFNNMGQIIGPSQSFNNFTLFLLQDGDSIDLFKLLPPSPFLNSDTSANDINDAGQIVGCNGPNQHAWLLQVSRCGRPTFSEPPFPATATPKKLEFGNGWAGTVKVSDQDGLEMSNVSLNGRYMAVDMSLPYYLLATSGLSSAGLISQRCELTPDSTPGTICGSRLVDFKMPADLPSDPEKAVVQALYEIDGIRRDPNDQSACLLLTQRYEFWAPVDPSKDVSKACEPTEKASCARFKPIIKYEFVPGSTADTLGKINTVQRMHFAADLSDPMNVSSYPEASTVIHDCNFLQTFADLFVDLVEIASDFPHFPADLSCLSGQSVISAQPQIRVATLNLLNNENPLETEVLSSAIKQGNAGDWDNFHQTSQTSVLQPAFVLGQVDLFGLIASHDPGNLWQFIVPGCPDCVHVHWRWSDLVRGLRVPSLPFNSPPQFKNGNPLILDDSKQSVDFAIVKFHDSPGETHPTDFRLLVDTPPESLIGQPQVFWYSATSSQQHDEFFAHGGFFTPDLGTQTGSNVVVQPVDVSTSTSPVTLIFDNILRGGITSLVTSSNGPTPPGGFALGSPPVYYDLTTTAVFSGTIQICINYGGVTYKNQSSIRLYHFEGNAWVDRTAFVDITHTTVCGTVTSLSPFAIFEPGDTIPPVTIATLSPSPNSNGWNNSTVTVALSSTDNEPGGTGVKQITFNTMGGQSISSTTVNGASASITINTEGITTLSFFAVDGAGNVEAAHSITIKLDKTPPTILGFRTPPPNASGWNNTDVTVSFACTDSLSGLAFGSPPANIVISSEGTNQQVTGICQDLAGNSASTTVAAINLDKTPPVLFGLPTVNCTLWPPNHQFVQVATITAKDALSGMSSLDVAGTSTEPTDQSDPDIIIIGDGTQPHTVQLRAERLGAGSGRTYTLISTATDAAGNIASATGTCVVPHDQSH